jgi:hypothetical protein
VDAEAVWAGAEPLNVEGGVLLSASGVLYSWPIDCSKYPNLAKHANDPTSSPYTLANGTPNVIAVCVDSGRIVALTRDYKVKVWGRGLSNIPAELR